MGTPATPSQRQVSPRLGTPRLASDSLHRSILLIDIEGYSRPPRTNLIRGRLRETLYGLLDQAIRHSGIASRQYEPKDQGDGVLVLFQADVPKNRLLHPLIIELVRGLVSHNATAPEREQMRLRVVVHAGELLSDKHGYFGEDLDEAFGLLNSDSLRACLAETASPLVLLVTDQIYQGIVKHEPVGIDPGTYKHVKVSVKGKKVYAWVQVHPGAVGILVSPQFGTCQPPT
jgi:class 3 adenylate cyclase